MAAIGEVVMLMLKVSKTLELCLERTKSGHCNKVVFKWLKYFFSA